MVSKKKIGVCLGIVTCLAAIIAIIIGKFYDELDLFWGLFTVVVTFMFPCLAIGVYLLSVHFKETKPKLSKFLWGFGIYILIATVAAIAYSICKIYGVISL